MCRSLPSNLVNSSHLWGPSAVEHSSRPESSFPPGAHSSSRPFSRQNVSCRTSEGLPSFSRVPSRGSRKTSVCMFYKCQFISLPRRTSLIAVTAVIRMTALEHAALERLQGTWSRGPRTASSRHQPRARRMLRPERVVRRFDSQRPE